jgi:hypothetical protein
LAYGGANRCYNDEETHTYFNRKIIGKTFGKPVLYLNYVWWMNPWALVEQVPIPETNKKPNILSVFLYHKYEKKF